VFVPRLAISGIKKCFPTSLKLKWGEIRLQQPLKSFGVACLGGQDIQWWESGF
jgi:hypothetical protein